MRFSIITVAIIFFLGFQINNSYSQEWIEGISGSSDKNFYTIQKSFNSFMESIDSDTVRGIKQYKRWEWFMEPRVFPSGKLPNPMASSNAIKKYNIQNSSKRSNTRSNGNWTTLGPNVSSGGGIGRINFVTFHPTISNTIYVGAPSGGLWESTNSGLTWTPITDDLDVIGCSDLIINPLNPNVMYLATSDGDASDTYSIGVLKSTDGGDTWQNTGLSWTVNQTRKIRKLLMYPTDTSIIYAATSTGIYKTIDGGDNWDLKQAGHFRDIEFKPGNPTVVYAGRYGYYGSGGFYLSTDDGNSFTKVTSGLPSTSTVRFEIAVTPDDTNYVYIVVARMPSNSNLIGVYRSTNSGADFSTMATSPNILGRYVSGSDNAGQGWYDLDIIASPFDRNEIYVGGINIWKSVNGGSNWSISAHWTGAGGNPYVHADIHAMDFYPNSSTFYVGCDGGVFVSKDHGNSYTDLSQGLVISQIYRIGISATDPDIVLAGLQDNGTKRLNKNWADVNGGDGFECIVDYSNNNYMYSSMYYGYLYRSSNGGNNFKRITTGINEQGAWLTPFVMDPDDPQTLYAAYKNVWKTTNRGDSWLKISNFSSSATFDAIAVAPSDPTVIYVAESNNIQKTTNGGTDWFDISLGLPQLSITYIAVHPENPKILWVTLSGYSNGEKIYLSTNGGDTWINYSGSLPNLPANCIVYQNDSKTGLYVGMDVGVYYRDSTLFDWIQFSNGIPNVIINELEIYYDDVKSERKIRAGTYGRGLWESELYYSPNTPPIAEFSATDTIVCIGYSNHFYNKSNNADSFFWLFPGGNPSASSEINPIVLYDSVGLFDVTLIVKNKNGVDSIVRTSYINVDPSIECIYTMPAESLGEIYTSCTGRLFDPGGTGDYFNNTNSYVTIAPKGASKIVLNFLSFDIENNSDSLCIYEGTGVNGQKIGTYTGSALPNEGLIISSGNSITIRIVTDNAITRQGFELIWRCIRSDQTPFAYFTLDNKNSCTGNLHFENKSLNNPQSYEWDFGDGKYSTKENPTHYYTSNGAYSVKLKSTNANGTDSFVVLGIKIIIPDKPIVFSSSTCVSGSVMLSAENENSIWWYDSIIAGNLLHKGYVFNTPVISKTTTFYAQRYTNGQSEYCGISSKTDGNGGYYSSSNGLTFDALKSFNLASVKVYALGSGNREIFLIDNNGDTINQKSLYIQNGEKIINLNFDVPQGNDYILRTGSNSTLWRTKESYTNFPYVINDMLSIKKGITDNNYYFFYNWEVQEKDVCSSLRTPVIAGVFNQKPLAGYSYLDSSINVYFTDNSSEAFHYLWDFDDNTKDSVSNPIHKFPDGGTYNVKLLVSNGCGNDSVTKSIQLVNSIFENESEKMFNIYPNPNNGEFSLKYLGKEAYEINIYNSNGKNVFTKKIKKENSAITYIININSNPKGIYFLKLITSENALVQKIIIE